MRSLFTIQLFFCRTSAFPASAHKARAMLAYPFSSALVLHPHFNRIMAPNLARVQANEGFRLACLWTYVTDLRHTNIRDMSCRQSSSLRVNVQCLGSQRPWDVPPDQSWTSPMPTLVSQITGLPDLSCNTLGPDSCCYSLRAVEVLITEQGDQMCWIQYKLSIGV